MQYFLIFVKIENILAIRYFNYKQIIWEKTKLVVSEIGTILYITKKPVSSVVSCFLNLFCRPLLKTSVKKLLRFPFSFRALTKNNFATQVLSGKTIFELTWLLVYIFKIKFMAVNISVDFQRILVSHERP